MDPSSAIGSRRPSTFDWRAEFLSVTMMTYHDPADREAVWVEEYIGHRVRDCSHREAANAVWRACAATVSSPPARRAPEAERRRHVRAADGCRVCSKTTVNKLTQNAASRIGSISP
jgi:hypothetical protein